MEAYCHIFQSILAKWTWKGWIPLKKSNLWYWEEFSSNLNFCKVVKSCLRQSFAEISLSGAGGSNQSVQVKKTWPPASRPAFTRRQKSSAAVVTGRSHAAISRTGRTEKPGLCSPTAFQDNEFLWFGQPAKDMRRKGAVDCMRGKACFQDCSIVDNYRLPVRLVASISRNAKQHETESIKRPNRTRALIELSVKNLQLQKVLVQSDHFDDLHWSWLRTAGSTFITLQCSP